MLSSAARSLRVSTTSISVANQGLAKRSLHSHWVRDLDRNKCFPKSAFFPKRAHLHRSGCVIRGYSTGPFQSPGTGSKRFIWAMIGINCAVFGAWTYARTKPDKKLLELLNDHALVSWKNIREGRYHTVITGAFSHIQLSHLAFNMFGLWVYGGIVAFVGLQPVPTLALSLGCAVAGSLAWLYEHNGEAKSQATNLWTQFPEPRQMLHAANGASGMVMGFAAAATCLAPMTPMMLIFIPVPIPLIVWTTGYAVMDLYYMDPASKVGHSAHLGGMVFGIAFYALRLTHLGGIANFIKFR